MKKRKMLVILPLLSLLMSGCDATSIFNKNNGQSSGVSENDSKKYTVTFMNGNEKHYETIVEEGKNASKPADPSGKEELGTDGKYYLNQFIGWTLDGVDYDFSTPITGDITLEAKYTKVVVKCMVTFKNGDVVIQQVEVEKGSLVQAPADPYKEEDEDNTYSFDKWMNGNESYDFSSPVMTDLVLTAKFITTPFEKYDVIFMNGETQYGETAHVKQNTQVEKPVTDPTKDSDAHNDYAFDMWMNGEEPYDFTQPVTGPLTLTAHYTSTVRKYEVKFMNGTTEYSKESLDAGSAVVAPQEDPSESKDGYNLVFAGWSTDGTVANVVSSFPTDLVSDLIYYAAYTETAIVYTATVHFDYEGAPSDETIEYTIENRDEKLEDIKGLLPSETEYAYYGFSEDIEDLPLVDNTINVVEISKTFKADLSGTSLPNELKVCETVNDLNPIESSVENSTLTLSSVDTGFIYTRAKYADFELDAKVKTSNGRLAIVFGSTDEQVSNQTGFADGRSEIGGRFSLYFMLSGTNKTVHLLNNDKVQSGKDEGASVYYAHVAAADINLDTDFRNIKITYQDGKLYVSVENDTILNGVSISTRIDANHIAFARADAASTIMFKHLSVNAYNRDGKSFSTSFNGTTLPHNMLLNSRTDSVHDTGVVTSYTNDGLTLSNVFTGYLYSAKKYNNFRLETKIKSSSGRLVITLGVKDGDLNGAKGFADGRSDANGRISLVFVDTQKTVYLLNNDAARSSGKDSAGVVAYTRNDVAASSIELINNYRTIVVEYVDGKLSVTWEGNEMMKDIAVNTAFTESMFAFAGFNAKPTYQFAKVAVTDLSN